MASSQIVKITNDLKAVAWTLGTISMQMAERSPNTLYDSWVALGMVFTPASANTVYAILSRHFDLGRQSLDLALVAAELDRNQMGQRLQTDQAGGNP